jgi:NADP-dependent 3-hydroxy acid dehydrogenase YdfG
MRIGDGRLRRHRRGDRDAACTKPGPQVGLSGTRVEPLEALAERSLASGRMCCPATSSMPLRSTALPKQAAEAMGAVDILVNNAGRDARQPVHAHVRRGMVAR